jgi:hypothetical protein
VRSPMWWESGGWKAAMQVPGKLLPLHLALVFYYPGGGSEGRYLGGGWRCLAHMLTMYFCPCNSVELAEGTCLVVERMLLYLHVECHPISLSLSM